MTVLIWNQLPLEYRKGRFLGLCFPLFLSTIHTSVLINVLCQCMLTTPFCYILLHKVNLSKKRQKTKVIYCSTGLIIIILNLKPGKKELVIYGSQCNVELKGSKINHATHYEYLGVSMDQHLTMS